MLRDAFACRRIAELMAREHDALLLRKLGLAKNRAAAGRYRRLVRRAELNRPKQPRLVDR